MSTGLTTRDGIFYFRARIPTHLVSEYGKAVVSVSLHTRDPAVAKQRARERRVELDRELEHLERGSSSKDQETVRSVLHLGDVEIDDFCNRYRAEKLAADELERIKGISEISQEVYIDIFEDALPSMKQSYARGEIPPVVEEELKQQLASQSIRIPRSAPSYSRLARAFQQAQIEVYESRLQRHRGEVISTPKPPSATFTIQDVFLNWKRQKGENLKSVRSFEQAFELFKSHCQTANATLVRKSDAIEFRNTLLQKGAMMPATIKKIIGFLRAAFQMAMDDDKLTLNPFSGVKVSVPKVASSEKTRLPFTTAEIQTIFNGPVYQPGYIPRPSLGAACYWLPILGLFTGARLEELAQLETTDITKSDEFGPYISIKRDLVKSKKRTKNLNSVRNFPVHPELISLGFIEFVESSMQGRIFPALRPDIYGIYSTSFSTWFGLYLDELKITDRTKVFHSYRHSFIQRCKEKVGTIPAEVREAMVGHLSASDIESTYGSALYPLAPQKEAMEKLDFPELKLDHLRVKKK